MQPRSGRPVPFRVGGRYELFSQLAAAPFGNLWAARIADGTEQGRIVAIRRIPKGAPFTTVTATQVRAAAFAATEVRHAKIAAVLDASEEPDEVAVVSEYVEGELLRSLQRRAGLRNEPVPDEVALRLVVDLLEAMEQASMLWTYVVQGPPSDSSAVGTIHGGVSPDSVLIATYGEALVLDLGIASLLRSDPNLIGHPDVAAHCAPEQLDPTARADERTDVFSIGIILWELLANLPLFGSPRWTRFVSTDGENPADSHAARVIRRRVSESPIARLDALVRTHERVQKPVADLVAKALSRDPATRFASLAEFRAALLGLGTEAFASAEATSSWLKSVAGTSIQARQAAFASLTGRSPDAPEFTDTVGPTLPPPISPADVEAVELDPVTNLPSERVPGSSPQPDSRRPPLPKKT